MMAHTLRPAPPPPPMRKGYVQVYEALYSYRAEKTDELTFQEGDLLYVLDQRNPTWWTAQLGNQQGLIPSNYVSCNIERAPIVEAATRGNLELVDECLKMGVSVNSLNKVGSSALHGSCQGGHLKCVQRLLNEPKLEINLQNKLGDTPLHAASFRGHGEIVGILLQHGARMDIPNRENLLARALAKTAAVIGEFDSFLATAGEQLSRFSGQDYGAESEDSD